MSNYVTGDEAKQDRLRRRRERDRLRREWETPEEKDARFVNPSCTCLPHFPLQKQSQLYILIITNTMNYLRLAPWCYKHLSSITQTMLFFEKKCEWAQLQLWAVLYKAFISLFLDYGHLLYHGAAHLSCLDSLHCPENHHTHSYSRYSNLHINVISNLYANVLKVLTYVPWYYVSIVIHCNINFKFFFRYF